LATIGMTEMVSVYRYARQRVVFQDIVCDYIAIILGAWRAAKSPTPAPSPVIRPFRSANGCGRTPA